MSVARRDTIIRRMASEAEFQAAGYLWHLLYQTLCDCRDLQATSGLSPLAYSWFRDHTTWLFSIQQRPQNNWAGQYLSKTSPSRPVLGTPGKASHYLIWLRRSPSSNLSNKTSQSCSGVIYSIVYWLRRMELISPGDNNSRWRNKWAKTPSRFDYR